MPLTYGSLFSGIGGLDLGFDRAGLVCKWQVEIDDYARRVLAKHWPNVPKHDDIKTFPPDQSDAWNVDVICGGFPCQDLSYAGKGAGLDGERSGLFYELARVVRVLRPRYVVLENVPALLTRGLDRVLGTLAEIGYDAEWECLPAAAFGALHIRDRVFVVAYDAMRGEKNVLHISGDERETFLKIGGLCSMEERAKHFGGLAVVPGVVRKPYGISSIVDRLRCLGNAVVPQVAEFVARRVIDIDAASNQKAIIYAD